MTMFEIGALCRAFLLGVSTLEVNGLERFMELLDSRRDPSKRTRGLITGILFGSTEMLGSCINSSANDDWPFYSGKPY
jgi:hypothetical protein